ncbi:MAG: homoserine kinase [Cyanobacteria bacterium MAG STY4_bin_9]|jgi:homoserine kinase|uniref:homoserine kinase n=1 Tax=unclassified Synechococcus TaxID=2626047 RepID=UPI000AA529A6|nr:MULTISPECIES: homoserine kinase [unclassified Synechococcus]MBN90076.1 homoserine kinase [Synechococcus sp. RS344]MCH1545257.1 homoserine kinase [Synechococcus sp. MOX_bin32]MCH1604894.1 homoserine kinase [Synechococcus sp. MOX_bin13]MCY3908983.1 homoserine kinase [Cyanobacteria bacterium MAG COS3_bin_20]MDD9803448.1 homoserine kinase [Cyanobacteria bacterium MAG STY1_bin_7]MDD9860926.1 homoserine kinase [Cyanobacteria bacterium MAG STY2_bin_7]MDD9882242.1 homoserine kinase [Cyanobacteria|tara:strand:+ start:66 stop:1013 length:948 start_codon:yes stop_codon:yes gene_type:complete
MAQPRIGQKVVVDVPATTANLGPGFDCLGAALDLNNRFAMRRIEGGGERFELIIEGTEGSHLRGGPENLVYRAAQRVWKAAGLEPVALEARVRLAVPPARGLGSSATAIVAGLMGANALVGEPLSKEKLLELAIDIEGHPDNVVPSLLGGLCMTAKAASQRWRVVRCEWTPSVKAVVAIPSIRLSTSEARRAMPKAIPVGDAVVNLGALTLLLQGLRTGNGDLISDGMHDRLHEPYRWRLIKGGDQVKQAAMDAGAWGCAISGAGPSVLALCEEDKGPAVSRAMVKAWEAAGVASRAPVLNLQTSGSHWQPADDE